ncbi:MAG: hypothetical protein K2X47_17255, partial [Bdellovibrionales bacterium]|nr:hypothetical protein [Bdellovibrionales bacterium]
EEVICESPTLEELMSQQPPPVQMNINGETRPTHGTFEPNPEQPLALSWTAADGFRFQVKATLPRIWIRGVQKWGEDIHIAYQNQRGWNFEIERLSLKALGQTGFFDSTQRPDLETRTAVLPFTSPALIVMSPLGMRYKFAITPGNVHELEPPPVWAKAPPKASYLDVALGLPNPGGNNDIAEVSQTPWTILVAHNQFPPTKSYLDWINPKTKQPLYFETGVLGTDATAISLVTGLSIYKYTDVASFADLRAQHWVEKMFGSDGGWAFQRWGITFGVFQYLLTPTEASKLRIIEGIVNYRLSPGVMDRDPSLFLSFGATNIFLPTITQATLPGVGIGWNRSGPWGLEKVLRKIGFSNRKKWFDGHLMVYNLPGATDPIMVANLRVTGRIELRPNLCFEGGWGIQYIVRQETPSIAALTASAARGFLGLQLRF